MDPPLKLITGVALAQLIAAGAAIALHHLPTQNIALGVQMGESTQMPYVFFWSALVFLMISLSFLLTGALRLRWPLRVIALLIFSGLLLAPDTLPEYAQFRFIMLALLWLWAGFVALATPEHAPAQSGWRAVISHARMRFRWAHGVSRPVVTVVFLLLWQSTLDVALLARTGWTANKFDLVFQLTKGVQLQMLTFVLIPFLFLAGSDFAELGELLGGAVAHGVESVSPHIRVWLTLGLTFAVAVGIIITSAQTYPKLQDTVLGLLGDVAIAALVALAIYGLLRWGHAHTWGSARLSGITLLLVVLGYFALVWVGIFSLVALTTVTQPTLLLDGDTYATPVGTTPAFSLSRPASWNARLSQSGGDTVLTLNGVSQSVPGIAFVVVQRNADASAASAHADMLAYVQHGIPRGRTLVLGVSGTDGAWNTQEFAFIDASGKLAPLEGKTWTRAEGGYDWMLLGLCTSTYKSELFPMFADMAHRWRPDLSATPATEPQGASPAETQRTVSLLLGVVPLIVGGLLGLWFVRRRGAHAGAWRVAGVFVFELGLFSAALAVPSVLSLLGLPGGKLWFLSLNLSGTQVVVAIATALLVTYVAIRRSAQPAWIALVRLALTLNVSLLFIALIYHLYDWAIGKGQGSANQPLSWAAGLIVVIALGWDLIMSGESFTNRNDGALPRSTRLLLYMGYIMLTATLVMYFSTQTFIGTATHESFFESEPWPQVGLVTLGVPMIVTTFALAAANWARQRTPQPLVSGASVVADAVTVGEEREKGEPTGEGG